MERTGAQALRIDAGNHDPHWSLAARRHSVHIGAMSDTSSWFRSIEEHFGRHHTEADDIKTMLTTVIANQERLLSMSNTLSSDLAAQTAAIQALATEVQNGLTANTAAIQALKDQIAAGTPVSAADLATLEGNTKSIQDATTALQAALNPAPTPPAP